MNTPTDRQKTKHMSELNLDTTVGTPAPTPTLVKLDKKQTRRIYKIATRGDRSAAKKARKREVAERAKKMVGTAKESFSTSHKGPNSKGEKRTKVHVVKMTRAEANNIIGAKINAEKGKV